MNAPSQYVLKYIGSKRRMIRLLSKMIPEDCTTYIEPFAGSASLALNCEKIFDRMFLNDLNSHIANFWYVASSPTLGPQLLEELKRSHYSWAIFHEAQERQKAYGGNRTNLVQWAADTYILNWQSFNGLGDYWRDGDHDSYKHHCESCLPLTLKSLWVKNIEVYNKNAIDILTEGNFLRDEQTFIYLDPPYLEELRSEGKLYQTDMPEITSHIDLLNLIKDAKAKILLSGYWSGRDNGSDLYDSYLLPHHWHRHRIGDYAKSCSSGGEKGSGTEWVWTNFEIGPSVQSSIAEAEEVLKISFNVEAESPCLMRWLAVQSPSQKGGVAE